MPGDRDTDETPQIAYEIDVEAPAPANEGPSAPGVQTQPTQSTESAPAPTGHPDPYLRSLEERVAASERQQREMFGEVAPYLAQLRSQAQQPAEAPFKIEELDTNPNIKPSDLGRYVQHEINQGLQSVAAQSEFNARKALSSERVRGRFNADAMGQGTDYDTLRNEYLEPIYRQNPTVQQVLHYAAPEDPAMAEMLFGMMCWAVDKCGNDPVKGLRAFADAMRTPGGGGAQEVVDRITQAAETGADRVLRAHPGANVQKRKLDAQALWDMPDKEFDRYVQATGGY